MTENRISSAWDGGGQELVWSPDECVVRAAPSDKAGVEAMEKQDWDLASEKFAMSVKLCPDKLNFRQLLRNCTCKRYRDNRTGAGDPERGKLAAIRTTVRDALSVRDWRRADVACEEGLAINPWDVELNLCLGIATRGRGFFDVARFSLAFARSLAPRNRGIILELIDLLRAMGESELADDLRRQLDWLDEDPETE